MSKTTKFLRRMVVSLIGFPIVAIGVVLIPLPGPGLLVCLAGFFVLSFEFDWAQRYVDRGRAELKKIMSNTKAKSNHSTTDTDKTKK